MAKETVTPRIMLSGPDREYVLDGSTIRCYDSDDNLLFTLRPPTEDEAKMVMEDLYYGAYSGG